jgi:ribosomal protein RSM22 (predicted rRNA methylase)
MPADDWCHFGARLERSALHRKLKDGALSYEDEKFSYVALTKEPAKPASARVIRRPDQAPGRIRVTLCERNRLHHIVATKRDKPLFRAARKTEWGQEWRISSGKDQAESERD